MIFLIRIKSGSTMSRLIIVIFILQLLLCSKASAQPVTVKVTGEYTMSQFENLTLAKERAIANALRTAAEQSGVYVKSYSQTQNIQLTTDEVSALAAAILKIQEEKFEQRFLDTGDLFIKVTITCLVSPKTIETLRNKVQLLDDYRREQIENARLQQEFETLKVQLGQAREEAEKQRLLTKITDSNRAFEAQHWYYTGNELQKSNDLDGAIDAYTKAIALRPDIPHFYNNRGLMYFQKDLYDQALVDFNQALVLSPLFIFGYTNRGLTYDSKGLFDQAIADYTQALAINPRHASAYYNRGVANSHKGLNDQAIADYTQAIEINPHYFDAYYNRGVTFNIKRLFDQAIDDYTKAIAIAPSLSDDAYNNRGQIYADKGLFDQAIVDFDHSLALNPSKIYVYFNKAFAFDRAGKYPEARIAYQQFLQYATPEFSSFIQFTRQRLTVLENMH